MGSRNEPRLLTADDLKRISEEQTKAAETLSPFSLSQFIERRAITKSQFRALRPYHPKDRIDPPKKKKKPKIGSSDVLTEFGCTCHVESGVFCEAETANDCVGIELLALGKPGGDIFNSDHWMYRSVRDHWVNRGIDSQNYTYRGRVAK